MLKMVAEFLAEYYSEFAHREAKWVMNWILIIIRSGSLIEYKLPLLLFVGILYYMIYLNRLFMLYSRDGEIKWIENIQINY